MEVHIANEANMTYPESAMTKDMNGEIEDDGGQGSGVVSVSGVGSVRGVMGSV